MRGWLPWGVAAAFALAGPGPLPAQTDDAVFGGWRWTPSELGSRPAGLGGAFVPLADGVKAAVANPAGLTLLPARELDVSSLKLWTGAATGTRRLRLAAYFTDVDGQRLTETGAMGASVTSLTHDAWEAGVAAGVKLARLRVGVATGWTHLDVGGEASRLDIQGRETERIRFAADRGHVRFAAGLLIDLIRRDRAVTPPLRLGVSYQPGFSWRASRQTAASAPASERSERTLEIRRPTLASAGLAWRLSARWSVLGQADLIRYREVVAALERNVGEAVAAGFRLPDQVEPRLGIEFTSPMACGCGIVKLRTGLRGRSPGLLRYVGADAARARAFPGAGWRTVATLGASIVGEYFGRAIRIDLDSADLLEGPLLSVGASLRF